MIAPWSSTSHLVAVEVGAGRVVFGDLGVVGAVFAPEPAGAGANQHHVARAQASRPPRRACLADPWS